MVDETDDVHYLQKLAEFVDGISPMMNGTLLLIGLTH